MDFSLITLGCDKNRVDSEKMLYNLQNAGHRLVNESDAEFVVINTCAFIDKAKKETIDTILAVAEHKKDKLKKIIVTGCFSQRYGQEVDFTEVDRFVNISDEINIVDIVSELFDNKNIDYNFLDKRTITTPLHYAYLKIADGCDNRCAYCAIPYIRGKYTSRRLEDIVSEAKDLVDSGVKEIILVAQDTTNYGKDIYGKPSLVALLKELIKLDVWKVRILYAYLEKIDDELLDLIKNSDKIAKYLDIPLQHIDNGILKAMNRRSTEKQIYDILEKLRKDYNEIALRSSFIVGFPTEGEKEHDKLVSFVKYALNYAGFFSYSKEEGTPAYKLSPTQSKRTINKWVIECEKAQVLSTMKWQSYYKDKVIEVIYEGIDYDKQCFYGRSEHNAPDIDTLVYFSASIAPEVGKVYNIKVTKTDFHLYGVVV